MTRTAKTLSRLFAVVDHDGVLRRDLPWPDGKTVDLAIKELPRC